MLAFQMNEYAAAPLGDIIGKHVLLLSETMCAVPLQLTLL